VGQALHDEREEGHATDAMVPAGQIKHVNEMLVSDVAKDAIDVLKGPATMS
jgi:hypothetical protein